MFYLNMLRLRQNLIRICYSPS